jgi:hypothetical protein
MAISSIGSLRSGLSRGLSAVKPPASPFSQALSSVSGSQSPASAAGSAATTPQQQYNQSLADLQKTLAGLFSTAGIDSSQPIAIEQGPEGNLSVSNGHPETDKIEQVLAANPELAAKFKSVAANLRVVKQAAQQSAPDPASSSIVVTLVGNQATANLV